MTESSTAKACKLIEVNLILNQSLQDSFKIFSSWFLQINKIIKPNIKLIEKYLIFTYNIQILLFSNSLSFSL